MRVFLAIVATLFFVSGLTAEDMSTVNYSTDNRLLSEVKTRMILDNGLVIHIWEWNEKAKELGLTPKAEIVDYCFTGQRLEDELLLGPAYAMSKVLDQTKLSLNDIDVFEIHEAFAGQVLTNIKCLADDEFCKIELQKEKPVGEININKVNKWGGSLSIGHPFGATGARLLTTAANRLIEENGQYAMLSACAAGAHGHAMIIKKYEG